MVQPVTESTANTDLFDVLAADRGRRSEPGDRMSGEAPRNARGFVTLPKVPCRTGGWVAVRETSLASEASFWLSVAEPDNLNNAAIEIARGTRPEDVPSCTATVQLDAAGARLLRDHLDMVLAHHRFGDQRAAPTNGVPAPPGNQAEAGD